VWDSLHAGVCMPEVKSGYGITARADEGREARIERLEALVLALDLHPLKTKRSFGKFRKALETKRRGKLCDALERLREAFLELHEYRLYEAWSALDSRMRLDAMVKH
jgi:hypothetical protein